MACQPVNFIGPLLASQSQMKPMTSIIGPMKFCYLGGSCVSALKALPVLLLKGNVEGHVAIDNGNLRLCSSVEADISTFVHLFASLSFQTCMLFTYFIHRYNSPPLIRPPSPTAPGIYGRIRWALTESLCNEPLARGHPPDAAT